MWLTRFTKYILTHKWQTLLLVFGISLLPVLGVFGIVIAAYITLVKDKNEGAVLTIAATIPAFVGFFLPHPGLNIFVWGMIGYTILSNLFTWVFAVMLSRKMNFSIVMQIAALIGVLAVSIVHLAYPNVIDWWGTQLHIYYTEAQSASNSFINVGVPNTGDDLAKIVDNVKYYATGFMAMLVMLTSLSTVVIAEWWNAIVFKPASLSKQLHNLRLNHLTGFLFVVSIAFAFWRNSVVIDMMPIINVLFVAAGLSLVHYFFGLMRSKYVVFWLIFFYIIAYFGMPVSWVFIIVLALLDIWLDFRQRLKPS